MQNKVSEKLEQKIYTQTRSELLDQWIKIAAVAPDVREFEQRIIQ